MWSAVIGSRRPTRTPVVTHEPLVRMQGTLLDHDSHILGGTLDDEFEGAAVCR